MRNLSSRELTIKIISVIAALVMWLYVMNEQNPHVSYVIRDVPVKLVDLDQSKFAIKEDSDKFFVNVKVKGRRSIVADLKPQDINAEVSLKGRIEGENLLPVSVNVPANVELLDFSPKEILVTLDSIIEEQIPVSIKIKGTPQDGFAAAKPVVKPEEVLVKGSRGMIESIKSVVAYVDVEGKNTDVVTTLPLRALDARGREVKGVTFRPETVEITVPVLPVSKVSVTPNIRGTPADGYVIRDIRVEPSVLMITAEKDILQGIQTVNTEQINIMGISRTITRDVQITLPSGVKVFNEEQAAARARVTVEIERLSSRELTLNSLDIDIANLSSGLGASVENRDIILTVNGPESIIDKVNNNMLKASVDASGLAEGEYTLKIKADVTSPYKIIKIEPDSIRVTVSRI